MSKKALSTLLLVPMFTGLSFAQGAGSTTTMICSTSDGTLRIGGGTVTLADYHMQFDSIVKDGVIRFADPNSDVVALLDVRDEDGLYLTVSEGGQTMQVVAARNGIRYEDGKGGTEPASPSMSSVLDLLRTASQSRK